MPATDVMRFGAQIADALDLAHKKTEECSLSAGRSPCVSHKQRVVKSNVVFDFVQDDRRSLQRVGTYHTERHFDAVDCPIVRQVARLIKLGALGRTDLRHRANRQIGLSVEKYSGCRSDLRR